MTPDNPSLSPTEKNPDIERYHQYMETTLDKFTSLNKRFVAIDIVDLRLVGLIILGIVLVIKIKNAISQQSNQIFTPVEFIAVITIGALLLILGSYFRVKNIQENRKAVDEASKTSIGRLEAGDWRKISI